MVEDTKLQKKNLKNRPSLLDKNQIFNRIILNDSNEHINTMNDKKVNLKRNIKTKLDKSEMNSMSGDDLNNLKSSLIQTYTAKLSNFNSDNDIEFDYYMDTMSTTTKSEASVDLGLNENIVYKIGGKIFLFKQSFKQHRVKIIVKRLGIL